MWTEAHVTADDMLFFRADNAYVWQVRGENMHMTALGYALATLALRSIDRLGLLDRLAEDGRFGVVVFPIGGRPVSRDLLDSIAEIYFLDRHLGVASAPAGLRVLDVGAGYGRLAHRAVAALPAVSAYLCTDAVPVSTFLCEYYVRFRGVGERVRVVPLDEVETALRAEPVDLAVNVHSFSECRIAAVAWWAALLARHRIRHLMLVPNPLDNSGERLVTTDGQDIGGALERHGYRLVARDPKYLVPAAQRWGMNPTYHYLFALGG